MLFPSSFGTHDAKQPTPVGRVKQRQLTKQQAKKLRIAARERFKKARLAEKAFARKLRAVARQIGNIVKGFAPDGVVRAPQQLRTSLEQYSKLLEPWAQQVSQSLVTEVARRDAKSWIEMSRQVGSSLRKEIATAPTGVMMRSLMAEQVTLITSLPIEAANRVHRLTVEGMSGGVRARETAIEILRTGRVTESRAMLIARTETSRTASAMTQARAEHVGSEGYIWRTSGDSDVRDLHEKLEGKYILWSKPPISGSNGERAHAGAIYNCRCWPEPVLPDQL